MKAEKIYNSLENKFVKPGITDNWETVIESIADLVTDNYKERSIGLISDFTDEINKVYTAVFPSDSVMSEILDKNVENALLFVHHPATWDLTAEEVFKPIDRDLLLEFKQKNISIYNLHHPLDNYSEYSTSKTLADRLSGTIERKFAEYAGADCGVICNYSHNLKDLKKKFHLVVGHKVSLYDYGETEIRGNKVAVIAGGGNQKQFLEEMVKNNVYNLVTGVSVKNEVSAEAHQFAQEKGINILGGTHYSTEKFACQNLTSTLKKGV